ncbi:MAG: hypothetical protein QGI24_00245 [Kiritimatiellia bacterium]|jgi:hypothetical protein|nr:hypothetical protein [Kiritimatiellia bacterium]MDP6847188.1 hypothetical protein [Kiritimatiellia bacterium]
MPTVNPQTFFRFAADHHALLTELYYKREGLLEAELLALIRRYGDLQSPSAVYMRDRLVELGILEHSPQATAQFEMTRPVASLVGYLLQEFCFTSVKVIQSYFQAIDTLASDLAAASDSGNSELLVLVNGELEDHVEQMRHNSRNNREKVISDVIRIKTNHEHMPPRQRYEVINRLWTRYIIPLRDIIDTQKAMDGALDRLDRIYADAQLQFADDGTVQQVVSSGDARLRRLRRDVLDDFHETIREVTPLYEELRQETAMARGASHALEQIGKNGLTSLNLPRTMGVCNWQQRGLFSDLALEAYLFDLRGYEPRPPEPLAHHEGTASQSHIDADAFEAGVKASLPIEDALAWLIDSYPDTSPVVTLRLYGRLHTGRYGATSFADRKRDYRARDLVLSAHPMAVAGETDHDDDGNGVAEEHNE